MRRFLRSSFPLALLVVALFLSTACSQNEFTEPGPPPVAPKDPPSAQRVEKGADTPGGVEAAYPAEPSTARYTGSVILPRELAPKVKPGMVLFIIAQSAQSAGGSQPVPLAAKRVAGPEAAAFPMAFELGVEDSMSGQPLPGSAEILVRLDGDGDLKTLAEGDLVAGPTPIQSGEALAVNLKERGK